MHFTLKLQLLNEKDTLPTHSEYPQVKIIIQRTAR